MVQVPEGKVGVSEKDRESGRAGSKGGQGAREGRERARAGSEGWQEARPGPREAHGTCVLSSQCLGSCVPSVVAEGGLGGFIRTPDGKTKRAVAV